MASKVLVTRILQQYGLTAHIVADVQSGYRSESFRIELADDKLVNVIIYKRESGSLQRVRNANRIGNYLAEQGVPVRRTLDSRIIRLGANETASYGSLYNYLPGSTIPWEAYTREHIKNLGGAMSSMHTMLEQVERDDLPSVAEEYLAIYARMQKYFAQPGVQAAMRAKLHLQPLDVQPQIELLESFDPTQGQALHMDFVRGNVLFEPNTPTITGILDFEKVAWGLPVFDIARTLAFLLVDCKYKTPHQVRRYYMDSGYNKRGSARFADFAALEKLLDVFLLHDFYKFILHSPYESLHANEHYVRTVVLLQARGVLDGAPEDNLLK